MKQRNHAYIKILLGCAAIIAIGGLLALSCAQDSIFYNVSLEPVPIEPRIAGSPTNLAYAGDAIYVGTRMGKKIHFFNGSSWGSMSVPGGSIGELAGDGTNLYALVFPGGDPLKPSVVKKFDTTTSTWSDAMSGYSIQSIYCAGGFLFAGAMSGSNYLILKDGESAPIATVNSLLRGVAKVGTDYFFATLSNGILKDDGISVEQVPGTAGNITGITNCGEVITAVSSNGVVYTYDSGVFKSIASISSSYSFTGAMCVWEANDGDDIIPDWKNKLLLLGIRDKSANSSYSHGYREMVLDAAGTPTSTLKTPGNESLPTSAREKRAKYEATIGTHPVESIFQVPNSMISAASEFDLPVFASTSVNGVWACRRGVWNAEE